MKDTLKIGHLEKKYLDLQKISNKHVELTSLLQRTVQVHHPEVDIVLI